MGWEYMTEDHKDDHAEYHCTSLNPVPHCKEGCKPKHTHFEEMRFECINHVHADGYTATHAGDNKEESFLHYYTKEVVDYCYKDYDSDAAHVEEHAEEHAESMSKRQRLRKRRKMSSSPVTH